MPEGSQDDEEQKGDKQRYKGLCQGWNKNEYFWALEILKEEVNFEKDIMFRYGSALQKGGMRCKVHPRIPSSCFQHYWWPWTETR